MNMLSSSLLLVPLASVLLLGLQYGPAVKAALNPGNEIMTSSNYTFHSNTFSSAGAIGSIVGDKSEPAIITGKWSLEVKGSTDVSFSSDLTMVNATGEGYRTIQLSNLSSAEVTVFKNGTALVTGMLDVTINGNEKLTGVSATISLAKLRALNMALDGPGYLKGPIYGTADVVHETSSSSSSNGLLTDGNSLFNSITEKFRLPQVPKPFR